MCFQLENRPPLLLNSNPVKSEDSPASCWEFVTAHLYDFRLDNWKFFCEIFGVLFTFFFSRWTEKGEARGECKNLKTFGHDIEVLSLILVLLRFIGTDSWCYMKLLYAVTELISN